MLNGVVLIDKPAGFTSHDVVAKLRRSFGIKKIGHAGTLDPMATGLLTLGVGPATRLLTFMVGLDKTYEATIRLGQSTVTDDREGTITETATTAQLQGVSDAQILTEIQKLSGDIEQIPSKVSAIKVQGKRAYDLVRHGVDVELKARPVTIHSFTATQIRRTKEYIDVDATISCSTGTYIRALGRDLGAALKTGAYLTHLRRTQVGPFVVAEATKIETATIIPPETVAKKLFQTIQLTDVQAVELLQGKRFQVKHEDTNLIAALSKQGKLLGLIEIKNGLIKAITNFPQSD